MSCLSQRMAHMRSNHLAFYEFMERLSSNTGLGVIKTAMPIFVYLDVLCEMTNVLVVVIMDIAYTDHASDITRGSCDDDFHGDTTLIAIRRKL